jgi:cytochrome c peroxidase
LLSVIGCQSPNKDTGVISSFTESERTVIERMSPMPASSLDETNRWDGNTDAITYGELLFTDTRISPNEISCSSCHDPDQGFSDGELLSEGVENTRRHSPSLWNIAQQRWFFWDGSCDTLWCQAAGPIEAPGEMNSSRTLLAGIIAQNSDLLEQYENLFGPLPDISTWPVNAKPTQDPTTPENLAWNEMSTSEQTAATQILVNVSKSIAAFESTIISESTAIDDFVQLFKQDEQTALDSLSSAQEEGLRLFVGEGECHLCHSGSLFTDKEFHNIGLGSRQWLDETDVGRYDGITLLQSKEFNSASVWSDAPDGERANRIDRLSQATEQLGQFKTPSLRKLSSNAPYMHGGHFPTLEEVVQYYSELPETPTHGHIEDFLEPRLWTESQIASMVEFLQMLSSTE